VLCNLDALSLVAVVDECVCGEPSCDYCVVIASAGHTATNTLPLLPFGLLPSFFFPSQALFLSLGSAITQWSTSNSYSAV